MQLQDLDECEDLSHLSHCSNIYITSRPSPSVLVLTCRAFRSLSRTEHVPDYYAHVDFSVVIVSKLEWIWGRVEEDDVATSYS